MTEPTSAAGFPIRLMSVDDFRAWHGRGQSVDYAEVIRNEGAVPFAHVPGRGFRWTCPDCGEPYLARVGDQPLSGWENPQWVLSGTQQAPTAAPSLGCGRMKQENGHHWWLREGVMVRA